MNNFRALCWIAFFLAALAMACGGGRHYQIPVDGIPGDGSVKPFVAPDEDDLVEDDEEAEGDDDADEATESADQESAKTSIPAKAKSPIIVR